MRHLRHPFLIACTFAFVSFARAAGPVGPAPIPDEKSAPAPAGAAADPNLATAPAPAASASAPQPEAQAAPADAASTEAASDTAAPPAIGQPETCSERLKDYVVAGSLTSKTVGARTWSLSRLSKAATKSTDSCAKALLTRAINEETDYWNHIRDKFKCANESGSLEANETCSEHLVSEVKLNLNWLKLFRFADGETERPRTEAGVCDEKCAKARAASEPISAANQQHLRDAVRAVTLKLPDASHAPAHVGVPAKSHVIKTPADVPVKPQPKRGRKSGSDGLSAAQLVYYNRFMLNPRRALDLDGKLEGEVQNQIYEEEAKYAKVHTFGEASGPQKRLKELRKQLVDINTAFERVPVPGGNLQGETN